MTNHDSLIRELFTYINSYSQNYKKIYMKKALVEIVRVSIGEGKIVNMSISDK